MTPPNNILVLIAALIVSVQSSSWNIASGSVAYDPNSITQNEKILRLFLRLASNTANRLIYLKNDVNAPKASTSKKCNEDVVPEMRMRLSDVKRGPYKTVYNDRSEKIVGPYLPAPADEILPLKYGRYRQRYVSHRRSDDQNYGQKKSRTNEFSPKNSVSSSFTSDVTSPVDENYVKMPEKSAGDTKAIDHGGSMEIASRMLVDGEKNNDTAHRDDNSVNVVNSDSSMTTSQEPGALNENIKSAATAAASMAESKLSEIGEQTMAAIFNLQAGSSALKNAIQGTKTVIDDIGASEITREAVGVTSGVQSQLSGILEATRGLSSEIQNVTGDAAISGQIEAAASKLHSASAGILDLAKNAASEGRSKVVALAEALKVEPNGTERLSVTTIFPEAINIVEANLKNRTHDGAIFRAQGHSIFDDNEALGEFVRNMSGEIMSKINAGTNFTIDQASLLSDSSRAMAGVADVGIKESANVVQAAGDAGSKVVREMAIPVESVAGKMIKLSEDSIGSKINGSGILGGRLRLKNSIESGSHGGSASTAMIESIGDGASKFGSRLLGAVPLFRSFPDVYNESLAIDNIDEIADEGLKKNFSEEIDYKNLSDTRILDDREILETKNEASGVLIDLQSRNNTTGGRLSFVELEYGNNEDDYENGISESDLQDFGRQFVDALRPVGSTKDSQR